MFGNLLNNTLIRDLIDDREIIITPRFDPARLQIAQYPLFPYAVYSISAPGKLKRVHMFDEDGSDFALAPNQYVAVDIQEIIQLPIGIVGRFIPASSAIEKGIGLTVGKLEHPYCSNGERIRFGIKNQLDTPTKLSAKEQLAYVQFFDLRGLNNIAYKLNKRDRHVFKRRIDPEIDGPDYERDNH